MKKIIAVVTLLLAFTINANAQEKKVTNNHVTTAIIFFMTKFYLK